MGKDVHAAFHFLAQDPRWTQEKPYSLKFQPIKDFPISNAERPEKTDVLVQDIRGKESSFTIDENGFAIMRFEEINMTYEDFGDPARIESMYLKAVGTQLRSFLGASRVQIFDYAVSFRPSR